MTKKCVGSSGWHVFLFRDVPVMVPFIEREVIRTLT